MSQKAETRTLLCYPIRSLAFTVQVELAGSVLRGSTQEVKSGCGVAFTGGQVYLAGRSGIGKGNRNRAPTAPDAKAD